jgi:hypothetical protein
MDAPYTGGLSPGGTQFAVDGDFTSCDPCSPPKITFPLKGDSIFSAQDLLYYNSGAGDYQPFPLGTYPNIKPWSPTQAAFVIEQEFMVALAFYVPLALNTPYNEAAWGIGWTHETSTGYQIPDLSSAILVEEGDPDDMGQGIIKIRRKFATIPPSRSDVEQYAYTFPGFQSAEGFTRPAFTKNVLSRLQYDYFVFDDLDILDTTLFPAGNRLDSSTGLYPTNLILNPQNYYSPGGVAINQFLDSTPPGPSLQDADATLGTAATVPSATDWTNWIQGIGTSNNSQPELIAESSTLSRYLGNIFMRRTRMVLLQ